jgi:hypothetical protein
MSQTDDTTFRCIRMGGGFKRLIPVGSPLERETVHRIALSRFGRGMRLNLSSCRWLAVATVCLGGGLCLPLAGQQSEIARRRVPAFQDWSTRHVVYPRWGASAPMRAASRDARARLLWSEMPVSVSESLFDRSAPIGGHTGSLFIPWRRPSLEQGTMRFENRDPNIGLFHINSFPASATLAASTQEGSGTSGMVVDNISSSAQASSVYFGALSTTATCGIGGTGGCAVKLTQAGLE